MLALLTETRLNLYNSRRFSKKVFFCIIRDYSLFNDVVAALNSIGYRHVGNQDVIGRREYTGK